MGGKCLDCPLIPGGYFCWIWDSWFTVLFFDTVTILCLFHLAPMVSDKKSAAS